MATYRLANLDATTNRLRADELTLSAYTSTEIAAFASGEKWNRRRVYDSTIGIWLEYNGTAWQACAGEKIVKVTGVVSTGTMSWTAEAVDYEGWITPTSTTFTVPASKGGNFHITAYYSSFTGSQPNLGLTIPGAGSGVTPASGITSTTAANRGFASWVVPLQAGDTFTVSTSSTTITGGTLEVTRLSY